MKASFVIGDENPLREPDHWRALAAKKLTIPLWTVDADVVVPSKLLEKEQYAARIIRPRLQQRFDEFLQPLKNPRAKAEWENPKVYPLCRTTVLSISHKIGRGSIARSRR